MRQVVASLLSIAAVIPAIQAQEAKIIREETRDRPGSIAKPWTPVITHTHNWRWRGEKPTKTFAQSQKDLVEWCRKTGVRALGLGSPWEPVSFKNTIRYEGAERDQYYAGLVKPESVMDRETILGAIAELNKLSAGSTLFYMDNETPKSRLSHLWWFGFQYEVPAWHDYSQDKPIKTWSGDPDEGLNKTNGEPHRRRELFEIMANQHRAGALGVFAHPTRWWVTDDHYWTNIASQSALFLTVYGRLDGLTVMGDRPYNDQYQKLWFYFLDTGAVVPGFAETDYLLTYAPFAEPAMFRNYMALPEKFEAKDITDAARRGESFASNGIFLTLRVDGQTMGSIVRTDAKRNHTAEVEAYPAPGQDRVLVQLVGKGGKVLVSREFTGGRLTVNIPGSETPNYLVARAFGAGDDPSGTVRFHAITNPIYLHPSGFKRQPAMTECRLAFARQSPWLGGDLIWETADGSVIEQSVIKPGRIEKIVPADARIRLRKAGQKERMFYIATENPAVEKCVQYLSLGEFRKDFPGLAKGQVPVEAFRLNDLAEAIRRFELEL